MKENYKINNMPKVKNSVIGRSSTLRGAFVQSILPGGSTIINDEDLVKHLSVLNMTKETIRCAYCGGEFSSWDHINPLVLDKAPTGYLNEINNLLPCCSSCNSSKGNRNWEIWMNSKKGRMYKVYNENPVEHMNRIALIKEYTTRFKTVPHKKLAEVQNTKEWKELEEDLNLVLRRWQSMCEHISKDILEVK